MNVINKNFIEPEQDFERMCQLYFSNHFMDKPILNDQKKLHAKSTAFPEISAQGNSLDNLKDNLEKNLKNYPPFRREIEKDYICNPEDIS